MNELERYLDSIFSPFLPTHEMIETKKEYTLHLLETITEHVSNGLSLERALHKAIHSFGVSSEMVQGLADTYDFKKRQYPVSILMATGSSELEKAIVNRLPKFNYTIASDSESVENSLSKEPFSILLISELFSSFDSVRHLLWHARLYYPAMKVIYLPKQENDDLRSFMENWFICSMPTKFTVEELENAFS